MEEATTGILRGDTNVNFVLGLALFMVVAFLMAFAVLVAGRLVRPTVSHPEKAAPYECGEPAIGTSWVQFDLRFYIAALLFIVFDVELVLLWPWAVVLKDAGVTAFWSFFVFFLLIAVPFLYEWKSGYLEWVRSYSAQEPPAAAAPSTAAAKASAAARAWT
jgi:NADH-quinone oxidoreductase subunit A